MNASIHKSSIAIVVLLSISGASYAAEPVAVNTEGMPQFLAAKVEAKAREGSNELRRFVWRTRMVYALDLKSIARG